MRFLLTKFTNVAYRIEPVKNPFTSKGEVEFQREINNTEVSNSASNEYIQLKWSDFQPGDKDTVLKQLHKMPKILTFFQQEM